MLHWASAHERFQRTFEVDAPVRMTSEDRDILQPLVTARLVEINKELETARAQACGEGDAACIGKKLKDVQAARERLNYARTAAESFDFDTALPPTEEIR